MIKHIVRLDAMRLEVAAKSAGVSIEKFVSEVRSISLGHEVCAHLEKIEGGIATFSVE